MSAICYRHKSSDGSYRRYEDSHVDVLKLAPGTLLINDNMRNYKHNGETVMFLGIKTLYEFAREVYPDACESKHKHENMSIAQFYEIDTESKTSIRFNHANSRFFLKLLLI